jgi:hypothetical protein
MARSEKQRLGSYDCLGCGKDTPVNKSVKTAKLACPCSWCDFTLYADPGTELYKKVMAGLRASSTPAPPASAELSPPAEAAPPAPAAAAARGMPWMRPAKN